MKKIIAIVLFSFLLLSVYSCNKSSNNPVTPTKPNLTGHWIGSGNYTYTNIIPITATVNLDLTITGTDDATGTVDQVLTGSGTMKITAIGQTITDQSIPILAGTFKNPDVNITTLVYTGKLSTDQKSIVGNMTYQTYTVPITLNKQ